MSYEKEWWKGTFAEDIHGFLRKKELKKFDYAAISPQLHLRRNIVEWLIGVCDKLQFCTPVRHLAIYLLDIFMDNHKILPEHMDIIALGCLMIAVKVEELDGLIPRNSDLNNLVENRYDLKEFVVVELCILDFFNYNVLIPTAAHFGDYYSLYALAPTDTQEEEKPIENYELIQTYVHKYIEYFLEITILDHGFRKFLPSLIAASCIAATRMCLGLTPPWPVQLQNLTLYKYSQLKICVEYLLLALERDMYVSRKNSLLSSQSTVTTNIDSELSTSLQVSQDGV